VHPSLLCLYHQFPSCCYTHCRVLLLNSDGVRVDIFVSMCALNVHDVGKRAVFIIIINCGSSLIMTTWLISKSYLPSDWIAMSSSISVGGLTSGLHNRCGVQPMIGNATGVMSDNTATELSFWNEIGSTFASRVALDGE